MQGAGGSQRRNPWAASEEGKVQPNSWEHEKATGLVPVSLDCQVPLSKVSETAICLSLLHLTLHYILMTKMIHEDCKRKTLRRLKKKVNCWPACHPVFQERAWCAHLQVLLCAWKRTQYLTFHCCCLLAKAFRL